MPVPLPDRRELADDVRRRRTDELLRLATTTDCPDTARRARSEVVELNLRVAVAVARRYAGRGVDLEDLEQTACEGLTKAVARFDTAQRRDLLTYAVPTIRGEVQRYFRDKSWMVRPRRTVQEVQQRLNQFSDEFAGRLDRQPTESEVCAELGIDHALYVEAVTAFGCFSPSSINRRVGTESGTAELGDLLPGHDDDRPAAEARVALEPLIRRLPERERRLLYLRFFEDQSQREIGVEFGIKQAQVSRLLDRIYDDLRHQLVGADDGVHAGTPVTSEPGQTSWSDERAIFDDPGQGTVSRH